MKILARYDGKVIVPEEPVDLPVDQRLQVDLQLLPSEALQTPLVQRRAALERFLSRPIYGVNLPDEAMRREGIYEGA